MGEWVLIPWGNAFLRASRAEFEAILSRGLAPGPNAAPATPAMGEEVLIDSAEMGKRLGVAAEWVEAKAKCGEVPSVMVGRYRRFNSTEVLRSLRSNGHADR